MLVTHRTITPFRLPAENLYADQRSHGFTITSRRSDGILTSDARAMMADAICAHLAALTTVRHAKRRECAECVKIGAPWVHLRSCQECGATLCCDSSPNQHASKHSRSSGHPVISSEEPGERWLYCYPDDRYAEY